MSRILIVLVLAVPLGLAFSAYNARLYRRRNRRLDAILAALAATPDGATATDLAEALGYTSHEFHALYADLGWLEQHGRIGYRKDADTNRMYWFLKGGAS